MPQVPWLLVALLIAPHSAHATTMVPLTIGMTNQVSGTTRDIGIAPLRVAYSAPSSTQNARSKIHNIPSIKVAQKMIMGEWEMSGPIPSSEWITRHKIWNTQCWWSYKVLDVRTGKAARSDAYVVELASRSAGGPRGCGHASKSSKPVFYILLIPEDVVFAGKATMISWLECRSENHFWMALQHQDPRDSNFCSRFSSFRVTRGSTVHGSKRTNVARRLG